MCFLKIYSDTDSFKVFLADNPDLPIYSCFDKGEPKSRNKLYESNRISFDVSQKEWDDFKGQVNDAILFLEKYSAQIKKLFATHLVTDACLDFPLWSRLDKNIVNQNDYIPKELIRIAGDLNLSIEMSIYALDAFDFPE